MSKYNFQVSIFKSVSISFVIFAAIVVPLFLGSCSDGKVEIDSRQTQKREMMPALKGNEITTIISDSGVARYRITTDKWIVYDKVAEPYWDFPEGIYFERFTPTYEIDAHMTANTAKYYEKKSLWEFNGDVEAKNLQGEIFRTEQMFWDENQKRIYSDKEISITQHTKIINGIGFESNSSLTRYTIRRPTGIIPVNR